MIPDLPKPSELWDYVCSEKGDPDADAVYLAVGRALSAWESLESYLATLFDALCETESKVPAWSYGLVIANATKAKMLLDAAWIFFNRRPEHTPLLDHFNSVLAHYLPASRRRNEIAHGIVIGFDVDNEDRGYFLMAAFHNSMKKTLRQDRRHVLAPTLSSYRFTSADIATWSRNFRRLEQHAAKLYRELFPLAFPERHAVLRDAGFLDK